MSAKDEKPVSPTDTDPEKSGSDQLQKQIDALVRGEVPKGSRSLRDLAKRPILEQEIRKKGEIKKSGCR